MKPPALIMPLCELGSLHEYLIDYTQPIAWTHRLAISRHIAEGLMYLQSMHEKAHAFELFLVIQF
jgi:hypothetical protein